ncbi:MAG: molybdenum cofactor guanylyltransferase [Chloroflexi bacterium]|nr:molybdenum cofactor guanylyltransferase [Chloroflexota bacterium]
MILAGGRGKRLGQDKAMLDFGGQPLVQYVSARLSPLSNDQVVVLRHEQTLEMSGVRLVTDVLPQAGVLAGITAGLEAARYDWSLVVACDMPFLNLNLLRYMIAQTAGYDVVVPRLEVGMEPLHALYHKRCLPALWQALERDERRVISFYETLRVRYIETPEVDRFDPLHRSFYNINTLEELEQARAWLREKQAQGKA